MGFHHIARRAKVMTTVRCKLITKKKDRIISKSCYTGQQTKTDHWFLPVVAAGIAPDTLSHSDWNVTSERNSKITFISSIKKTLAPAINLSLMCDFVAPLFRDSRGTFYWIIWRHHRTQSLIPPLRETVTMSLVVRVYVDVWCSSTSCVLQATVAQGATRTRRGTCGCFPASPVNCGCCGEA